MWRRQPSTFKPDSAKLTKLIETVGLAGELRFDELPRSVKFSARYSGSRKSWYSISRTVARDKILAAAGGTKITYADVVALV